jgi:hypothetical protein
MRLDEEPTIEPAIIKSLITKGVTDATRDLKKSSTASNSRLTDPPTQKTPGGPHAPLQQRKNPPPPTRGHKPKNQTTKPLYPTATPPKATGKRRRKPGPHSRRRGTINPQGIPRPRRRNSTLVEPLFRISCRYHKNTAPQCCSRSRRTPCLVLPHDTEARSMPQPMHPTTTAAQPPSPPRTRPLFLPPTT